LSFNRSEIHLIKVSGGYTPHNVGFASKDGTRIPYASYSKPTETAVKTRLCGRLSLSITIITTSTKTSAGQLQDKVPFEALKGLYSPFNRQDVNEEINFILPLK